MKYQNGLLSGRLIQRYKRFLADIELDNGELITAHCANTGAMTHCADPGCRVWVWDSQNPKRKLPYSWEWTEVAGRWKACVNTARANQLVEEALLAQLDTSKTDSQHWLHGYQQLRKEPRVEDGRLDFLISGEQQPSIYIEVKSLTLPRHEQQVGLGCFPDARTERGLKHLRRLAQLQQQGHQAILLFCVSLEGIEQVAAAADVDLDYAAALAEVQQQGVRVIAWPVRFDETAASMQLDVSQPLPLRAI
ncbi:DNA/RNA nuclease SfsA [Oceanobacter mangrovi]|uniref:DNA/RNA nuclease SfsA n=1 Tax=Oceanobacter mangrovi TaxID=2862510 RepID=UPI001C8DC97F|nr:DNA/RNA nuclease SfsA [Oceanobacter mangrovi]